MAAPVSQRSTGTVHGQDPTLHALLHLDTRTTNTYSISSRWLPPSTGGLLSQLHPGSLGCASTGTSGFKCKGSFNWISSW